MKQKWFILSYAFDRSETKTVTIEPWVSWQNIGLYSETAAWPLFKTKLIWTTNQKFTVSPTWLMSKRQLLFPFSANLSSVFTDLMFSVRWQSSLGILVSQYQSKSSSLWSNDRRPMMVFIPSFVFNSGCFLHSSSYLNCVSFIELLPFIVFVFSFKHRRRHHGAQRGTCPHFWFVVGTVGTDNRYET